MPFAYYGAKHRLAPKYPAPKYGTVIEPFAGSAAYSMRHVADLDRVVLIEIDPAVVALWERLKQMTNADLDAIDDQLLHDRTYDPLIAGLAGGTQLRGTLAGRSRQITQRMKTNWPPVKARIKRALPHLNKVEIYLGTYDSLTPIEATYFIDPPYQGILDYRSSDGAGRGYRFSNVTLDYSTLAKWCQSLTGQVIVCEQEPASWLPFQHLASHAGHLRVRRNEVVWISDLTEATGENKLVA